MPNYVRNLLVIIGKSNSVQRVLASLRSEHSLFDMEKIIPIPKNSKEDIHNWKKAHWGATDAVDCVQNRENIISFSTSWTPPLKAVEALARKIPEVNIRYYWANDDIGTDTGMQVWKEGELIEETRPYNMVYYYCWGSVNLTA